MKEFIVWFVIVATPILAACSDDGTVCTPTGETREVAPTTRTCVRLGKGMIDSCGGVALLPVRMDHQPGYTERKYVCRKEWVSWRSE